MKVVIINHSDTLGGASVVSFRLMEALRAQGIDARMLVGHKNSSSEFVVEARHHFRYRLSYLSEHLRIFLSNGLSRKKLFSLSIATDGLPLSHHPLVSDADIVVLAWVNQGLLSLKEIGCIGRLKPIVWVMHDMWNITGGCHHAHNCMGYLDGSDCRVCPLLGDVLPLGNICARAFRRKYRVYEAADIGFVAVSSWLGALFEESTLTADLPRATIIPNPFPLADFGPVERPRRRPGDSVTIIMGAARLDDPIKGFPIAIDALNILADRGLTDKVKVIFFGALRRPEVLDTLRLPYKWEGMVSDAQRLKELYAQADIVMSSSLYETLPGTLVEGQAMGCYPVTFGNGGQPDIVDHPATGYIARPATAKAFADALEYALLHPADPAALRRSVEQRFSYASVASRFEQLFKTKIEEFARKKPNNDSIPQA